MTGENRPRGNKRSRNLTAELAGIALSKQPVSFDGRKPIDGYAIDSVDPTELTDRDDAIGIEYRDDPKRGKLTILHVSIADVAARVPSAAAHEDDPRRRALDEMALEQGQTKYFRHGTLPMFPRKLQDQMSLENHQQRPVMTISMTYDQECNLIHTEFSRRRIRTHCKSYEQATQEILHPSVENPDMHNIAMLAKNLLMRKPGETKLPYYDAETGTYYDSEGHPQHLSGDASSSYLAVQGCMVAANEAAAKLMSKSNFLFRNHFPGNTNIDLGAAIKNESEKVSDSMPMPTRQRAWILQSLSNSAEYGVECLGHQGLKSDHYSHVTSPIRRYADVVNQRMMHWAIDVIDSIAEETMRSYWLHSRDTQQGAAAPKRKRVREESLRYELWEHAEELLGTLADLREVSSQTQRYEVETRLHDQLRALLGPICGGPNAVSYSAIKKSVARLKGMDIPYRKQEIADVAHQINVSPLEALQRRSEIVHGTLDTLFYPQTEDPEKPNYVPNIENMHEAIRNRRACRFAEMLEAAALRGDMNAFFMEETLRRLHSEDDLAEQVRNINTVLTIAERQGDSRWERLRREAFQMLKTDPILANRAFADLRKRSDPPCVFILETSLLDEEHVNHPTALVVLNHEGVDYSAPVVDTADNPAAARQAAILTFYRNYGNLSPHEEQYTPKLIDLALSRARDRKGERLSILKKMCGKDFKVEEEVVPYADEPSRYHITLRVTDNQSGDSIEKTRDGQYETPESYLDKLAIRMIEDRRFVDMMVAHDITSGQMSGRSSSKPPPGMLVRGPVIEESKERTSGLEPFS